MARPSGPSTSATCCASSRVGTSTRPRGALPRRRGSTSAASRVSRGRPNASVLPDPVWARPSTSLPASASGSARRWMANGASISLGRQRPDQPLGQAQLSKVVDLRLRLTPRRQTGPGQARNKVPAGRAGPGRWYAGGGRGRSAGRAGRRGAERPTHGEHPARIGPPARGGRALGRTGGQARAGAVRCQACMNSIADSLGRVMSETSTAGANLGSPISGLLTQPTRRALHPRTSGINAAEVSNASSCRDVPRTEPAVKQVRK